MRAGHFKGSTTANRQPLKKHADEMRAFLHELKHFAWHTKSHLGTKCLTADGIISNFLNEAEAAAVDNYLILW